MDNEKDCPERRGYVDGVAETIETALKEKLIDDDTAITLSFVMGSIAAGKRFNE